MSEHERAIVEAATAVAERMEKIAALGEPLKPEMNALVHAVRAKRKAETPQLLTAEEAVIAYRRAASSGHLAGLDFVLTACLKRAALVADEALAKAGCVTPIPNSGGEYLSYRAIVRHALTGKD